MQRVEHVTTGWRVVQWSATAALLMQAVSAVSSITDPPAGRLLGVLVFHLGVLALRVLAAYGVWRRARWGAWLGGVVAFITIPWYGLAALSQLVVGGTQPLVNTPLTVIVAWVQVAAAAAFLTGLILIRRGRGGK